MTFSVQCLAVSVAIRAPTIIRYLIISCSQMWQISSSQLAIERFSLGGFQQKREYVAAEEYDSRRGEFTEARPVRWRLTPASARCRFPDEATAASSTAITASACSGGTGLAISTSRASRTWNIVLALIAFRRGERVRLEAGVEQRHAVIPAPAFTPDDARQQLVSCWSAFSFTTLPLSPWTVNARRRRPPACYSAKSLCAVDSSVPCAQSLISRPGAGGNITLYSLRQAESCPVRSGAANIKPQATTRYCSVRAMTNLRRKRSI